MAPSLSNVRLYGLKRARVSVSLVINVAETFKTLMPNGIPHPNQLDESSLNLRVLFGSNLQFHSY